jgi:hypothetical protein
MSDPLASFSATLSKQPACQNKKHTHRSVSGNISLAYAPFLWVMQPFALEIFITHWTMRTKIIYLCNTYIKDHTMDDQTRLELEAAAFRALRDHLMVKRTDVQNIDMMNLTGFCRNCLSSWYQEAANERGIDMDKDTAREIFYGMSMDDWKAKHQTDATADQQKTFEKAFAENVGTKN